MPPVILLVLRQPLGEIRQIPPPVTSGARQPVKFMNNKNSVIKNVLTLAGFSSGLQLLAFAYRVYISRKMGPESMGLLGIVGVVYSIVYSVCIQGTCVAVTVLCSKDKTAAPQVVSSAKAVFLKAFCICAGVILPFPGFIAGNILGDARVVYAVVLYVPCLLLTGFENIYKAYYYSTKQISRPIISEYTEQLTRFCAVFIIFLSLKTKSPQILVGTTVLAMVIAEVASSVLLHVIYRRKQKGPAKPDLQGQILKIAAPIGLSGLLNNLLGSVNTVLLPVMLMGYGLSRRGAVSALGLVFGMVMPLLMLPAVVITSLCTIILPRISESLGRGNYADVKHKSLKTIKYTMLFSGPFLLLFIPFGNNVSQIVYKTTTNQAFFLPLVLNAFFVYLQIVSNNVLNGLSDEKHGSLNSVLGSLVQVLFTAFLVVHFGINAFLYGGAAGSAITALLNLRRVFSLLKSLGQKPATPSAASSA